MSELQAGIPYAGTPGKMYAEKRGGTPCVTIELDLTHQAHEGAWHQAPMRDDDGKPYRIWLRLFTTDKAWPYTEKKLRSMQFNGDFRNPSLGVASVVVIGTQNGQYIEWNLGGEHEAVDDKTLSVLTARYQQNNPGQKPQTDSPPPPPQGQPAPTAPQSPQPEPVPAGAAEDLPF